MTETAATTIFDFLTFEPTRQQAEALYSLSAFLDSDCTADAFVLTGAAGTGKTSLVKAVVDYLGEQQICTLLTAPTGRAAKVLGHKTQVMAHTLHHTLYVPLFVTQKENEKEIDERVYMRLREIEAGPYSIFIVDEASMLSDQNDSESLFCTPNSLLHDLLHFVKGCNASSKIVFIGDSYQLKPIKGESVGLDASYLRNTYRLDVQEAELTEVKRQNDGSDVLRMATDIRERCQRGAAMSKLPLFAFWNVAAALTYYCKTYNPAQLDRIVMIASNHRDVNWFNNCVRNKLGLKGTLAVGDLVMIGKNTTVEQHQLVNGDMAIVTAIHETTKVSELIFTKATLQLTDYEGKNYDVTHWVMIDTLLSDKGQIMSEAHRNLVADRMKHNPVFRNEPYPWNDEFVGALYLRYGHALTCHKAQGGEWDEVIMHPWFRANDHRYAYTAITRARKRVQTWQQTSYN
jgi:exodeoxyribonuclease V